MTDLVDTSLEGAPRRAPSVRTAVTFRRSVNGRVGRNIRVPKRFWKAPQSLTQPRPQPQIWCRFNDDTDQFADSGLASGAGHW